MRDVILVPRRGTARGQDDIDVRPVQSAFDQLWVIHAVTQIDGRVSPTVQQAQQHWAVRVENLVGQGVHVGASDDLVSRGQHADAQRLIDLHFGDPEGRQQSDIRCA